MHNMIELNNAQIRIEERDAKIERQAEVITKLEASRTGLKKENKQLREKVEILRKYTKHHLGCDFYQPLDIDPDSICECGLKELKQTLEY